MWWNSGNYIASIITTNNVTISCLNHTCQWVRWITGTSQLEWSTLSLQLKAVDQVLVPLPSLLFSLGRMNWRATGNNWEPSDKKAKIKYKQGNLPQHTSRYAPKYCTGKPWGAQQGKHYLLPNNVISKHYEHGSSHGSTNSPRIPSSNSPCMVSLMLQLGVTWEVFLGRPEDQRISNKDRVGRIAISCVEHVLWRIGVCWTSSTGRTILPYRVIPPRYIYYGSLPYF